ncbi:MAG: type III pantothenate kinase [Bacteroidales bacterium]
MPLPFTILYRSPETLGADRIAAVAGAHNKFGDTAVLVIDAGTAVTYDLLLKNGTYPGGNISPGMATRFQGT